MYIVETQVIRSYYIRLNNLTLISTMNSGKYCRLGRIVISVILNSLVNHSAVEDRKYLETLKTFIFVEPPDNPLNQMNP